MASLTTVLGTLAGGGGGSPAVGARVELSGNQNVPDATDTVLSWGTEIQDDDNFWDVGQPTRFTANTAGWHMVVGNVVTEFFSNSSDDGSLFVRKNGAGFVTYAREVTANLSASFIVNVSALVYLNATDYVELWWSLNSGAARDVLQDTRTSFSIVRL